jgi:predicted nucleic acid-binding protein
MAQQRCLVDTNVLLRLENPHSDDHSVCDGAIRSLQRRDALLYYTLQNASEFWNVSTRPLDRNGQGLTSERAAQGLSLIEQKMTLLSDNERVYTEWRRLVVTCHVKGVQVHDARLAAAMIAHQIPQILTLNGRDFDRFTEIEAIHPATLL